MKPFTMPLTEQLQWVIDTTGFDLLFGLKNQTTNNWLFRYETPLSSQRSHSALLVPLLQKACVTAKIPVAQIKKLTICTGPGSFTGLRAGLATVKTLGQWLPSLEITPATVFERLRLQMMLAQKNLHPTEITVLLDAKQNRLYTATWSADLGWEQPQFILLDVWLQQQEAMLALPIPRLFIVNEALLTIFPVKQANIVTVEILAPFALDALSLTASAPVSWQQLEPLYLQSPNITIKKMIIKDVAS